MLSSKKTLSSIGRMVRVAPWGAFYHPPKAYTVILETVGMSIALFRYTVRDWPSRENAKFAEQAAESARRVFIDQFTETWEKENLK
jgi:hypothetical protein